MSAATKPRGDTCPNWCAGRDHRTLRTDESGFIHPDDRGVYHDLTLDRWTPRDCDRPAGGVAEVRIEAFRHDNGTEDDWPDMVVADHVSPGSLGGVSLGAADARRLGEALIKAASLIEGGPS